MPIIQPSLKNSTKDIKSENTIKKSGELEQKVSCLESKLQQLSNEIGVLNTRIIILERESLKKQATKKLKS